MAHLLLIDGSAYLFRAYHALPHFTNQAGFPTGAIFGVLNMLKKLKEEFKPENIVLIFDAKGPNFRHDLYPNYKANRTAMPENLVQQIEPLHHLIQLLGFPLFLKSGVEADDVIGTLAKRHATLGDEVLIISSDKDLAQLLAPGIRMIDTMKNVEINDAYLIEKFGIHADKIVDFLALTGDTSDNIPGIPGVGPKTAAKWLAEYGSLEEIMHNHTKIGGKVGKSLATHLHQLPLAKDLATIRTDLELADLPPFQMKEPNFPVLLPLLKEYGLKSWIAAAEAAPLTQAPIAPTLADPLRAEKRDIAYHLIDNPRDLQKFLLLLKRQPYFAFDTETNGLDPLTADLVGLSFSFKNNEAYFIPTKHNALRQDASWPNHVLQMLSSIFADPLIAKIAHNAKFDLKVLHHQGLTVSGLFFDTLLAAYVLQSQGRNNLEALVERELGRVGQSFEDLVGTGRNKIAIEDTDLRALSHYACEDADFTWQLYEILRKKLDDAPKMNAIFTSLEMPISEVLAAMEEYGVLIDCAALKALSVTWSARLREIGELIFTEVGLNFNLNSPKQLIHVLFEKLGLPIVGKTPKGEPSTNEATLQELAPLHPVANLLLEHRHLSKLKNTYADKLPELADPATHRIHTQYQQAVVATGRLSSTDPNLQNIPFKTLEGKKIRSAIIAPPGSLLISADYSQIELRIMAHLSGDTGLIDAFLHGRDIHRATASEVLCIPESEITIEQRNHAKAVNFGLIYGMSSFGLAKQLGISRKDADAYITRYFERYPGVLRYMEATRVSARQHGYVETLLGRRLTLPQIYSHNKMEQKGAERAAINAPMQGTAADLIKKAMIEFSNWQKANPNAKAHLIMQVHDELVVECIANQSDHVAAELKRIMENAWTLKVPLVVDLSIGQAW